MYASVQSIKEYLFVAEQLGIDIEKVIEQVGLNRFLFEDGQATIDADVLIKLLQMIIPLSQDPTFGLTQATYVQANSFQTLGYLALNSSNTKETMDLVIQYEGGWGTTGKTFYEELGNEVFVSWHCNIEDALVARHMVENVLASWRLYSKSFVNLDEAPKRVWFSHGEPGDLLSLQKYQQIFNCPVLFNQPRSGLWVSKEQWLMPLPQANQAMLSVLEKHAASQVRKFSEQQLQDKPYSEQICRLLRLMIGHSIPQKRQIARQLGVSERTLQRMLKREGTQYQQLLAQVRLELAIEYLRYSDFDTAQIAQKTGFSEVRSFYRFLKQQTGKTATQIRLGK